MMLLTEEEMKTKWCPMARVRANVSSDRPVTGYNRIYVPATATKAAFSTTSITSMCIGSDCALWRWEMTPQGVEPKRGYCGLGMPQL